MRVLAASIFLVASACGAGGMPDADKVWGLTLLDGAPFEAQATLQFPSPRLSSPRFPSPRQITGQAPCNSYGGTLNAPWPAFRAGPLRVTRRACPELDAEQAFLAALGRMDQGRVDGDTLVLTGPGGGSLTFTAR